MLDTRIDPLLDPVVNWMFSSTKHNMDIAACELINAVFANAGHPLISHIFSLRSQLHVVGHSHDNKAVRLDLTVETDDNQVIAIEVLLGSSRVINRRSALTASWLLCSYTGRGAVAHEEAVQKGKPEFPKAVVISFLREELLAKEHKFHQTMSIRYDDIDLQATDQMLFHNIELAKFLRLERIDLDNPLHRWLWVMTTAYKNSAMLEEVRKMSPGLDAYIDRYEQATQDRALRDEALKAAQDIMLRRQEEYEIRVEAIEQGIEQGIERGRIGAIKELYCDGYIKRDVVEMKLQALGLSKERAQEERKKWDDEIELERGDSLTM